MLKLALPLLTVLYQRNLTSVSNAPFTAPGPHPAHARNFPHMGRCIWRQKGARKRRPLDGQLSTPNAGQAPHSQLCDSSARAVHLTEQCSHFSWTRAGTEKELRTRGNRAPPSVRRMPATSAHSADICEQKPMLWNAGSGHARSSFYGAAVCNDR